jgi:hypothetical protein
MSDPVARLNTDTTAPEGTTKGSERFIVVTNWFEELRRRMGN